MTTIKTCCDGCGKEMVDEYYARMRWARVKISQVAPVHTLQEDYCPDCWKKMKESLK